MSVFGLARLLLTVCVSLSANAQQGPQSAPEIPFDSLFVHPASLPLVGDTNGFRSPPTHVRVTPDRIFILDDRGLSLKIFDRRSGRYVNTVRWSNPATGEPGRIAAIDVDTDGRLHALDVVRDLVIILGADGAEAGRMHVMGRWHDLDLINASAGTRTILTGRAAIRHVLGEPIPRTVPDLLHEVTGDSVTRSFYPAFEPAGPWRRALATYFSASMGSVLVSGTYGSRTLHFQDVATGRSWSGTLAAPWLEPLEWPADSLFLPFQQETGERLAQWVWDNALVSRLIGIDDRYFVAGVQMHVGAGPASWGYLVGDTSGNVVAVSARTSTMLLDAVGDTLFSLAAPDGETYALESRVLRLPAPAR